MELMLERERIGVRVSSPEAAETPAEKLDSPYTHRREVVGRLLHGGLSPETLCYLLPEWSELVDQIADEAGLRGTG